MLINILVINGVSLIVSSNRLLKIIGQFLNEIMSSFWGFVENNIYFMRFLSIILGYVLFQVSLTNFIRIVKLLT